MKTLSMLAILATLLILALKQPEQSFQEASAEAWGKAIGMISSMETENEIALIEEAIPSILEPDNDQKNNVSNVWVIPHSTQEPGLESDAAPVIGVVTEEFSALPPISVDDVDLGEGSYVATEDAQSADTDYAEISRLYEESARLLAESK